MRRSGLILLLVAIVVLQVSSHRLWAVERPTVAQVTEGLTCQCGCGLTVANCNHPTCSFSVPVREQVQTMIGKGQTMPEIIGFYQHKYGEKVLSAPTTEGFNLLAWIAPFLSILLGGGFIVVIANRWRSRSALNPNSQGRANHLQSADPELKHRLEEAIREQI